MQTRRSLLQLLFLAEILPSCRHTFATNFPKEILSAPNFEAEFWIRPYRVSFSFIRDTANFFLAQSFLLLDGMRAGRIAYQIWICSAE